MRVWAAVDRMVSAFGKCLASGLVLVLAVESVGNVIALAIRDIEKDLEGKVSVTWSVEHERGDFVIGVLNVLGRVSGCCKPFEAQEGKNKKLEYSLHFAWNEFLCLRRSSGLIL
jgi:hypothetical protein